MNCSEFSSLLDLYVDGELSAEQMNALKKHAAVCEKCAKELAASEQLRDILSHMDDDVAVPLQAQAAWRNAIRAQARRRQMRRIYGIAGAAAAVLVLTIGVTGALRGGNELPLQDNGIMLTAHVEADGLSEQAKLEASAAPAIQSRAMPDAPMSYVERTVVTEDAGLAYQYLNDILAEYGGTIEREAEDTSGKRVYAVVPAESAQDFISAVDHIGEADDEAEVEFDADAASVSVCVIIAGK